MGDRRWRFAFAAATALCIISGGAAMSADSGAALASPNGRVQVSIEVPPGEGPRYAVSWRGRPLIEGSSLSFDLADGGLLGPGLRVIGVKRTQRDRTFTVFPGKTSKARDHYNEAVVSLEEPEGLKRRVDLVFRAYDDGVAFRFRFPKQTGLENLRIRDERSSFTFAGNPKAWALPVPGFQTHYEFEYRPQPLNDLDSKDLLALPLLLEYPDGTAAAILEADLTDYAGMYLGSVAGSPGTLVSRLSPRLDDPTMMVKAGLPHSTPWRVIQMGDGAARLIESDLLWLLNPPSAIKDTSWIRPGLTSFTWWNGFDVGDAPFKGALNTETMKHYIDFCAEAGIPYFTIDGLDNIAWYGGTIVPYTGADITKSVPEIDLPGVIAYAREKGVRLRFWMNSAAPRKWMKTAFPLYEKWGIEGIMADFVERDDQETNNFIREMVAFAAKHHLTVTLHNIAKPTGMTRTYPNLLTVEAVRNLEFDKWDPVGILPEFEVTVPFTRMLAGPTDFHSGSFRNVQQKDFKPQDRRPVTIGTRARQLARYVVYEGYMPMAADSPTAYRGQPGLDLLTSFPTYWDETRVLSGEVGKHVTIARRKGRQWYIGSMNDGQARTLSLDLGFLGRGRYTAEIWSDDVERPEEPARLLIGKREVTAGDTLIAALAAAGGHIVRLTPLR